jgi:hypothetical protein
VGPEIRVKGYRWGGGTASGEVGPEIRIECSQWGEGTASGLVGEVDPE